MPARCQRKVVDCYTGEQLGAVLQALQARKIKSEWQLWEKNDKSFFRVFVYVRDAEEAKEIVAELNLSKISALFAKGQQILKELQR